MLEFKVIPNTAGTIQYTRDEFEKVLRAHPFTPIIGVDEKGRKLICTNVFTLQELTELSKFGELLYFQHRTSLSKPLMTYKVFDVKHNRVYTSEGVDKVLGVFNEIHN